MRKILGLLACLAVALSTFLFNAPAASAATGVVSNGIGWTTFQYPPGPGVLPPLSREDCTLGVVGTDMYGNKVAITAAHCASQGWNMANDGAPIYRMAPGGPRQQIGTIAYRSWNGTGYPSNTNWGTDYLVIKLNNDAILSSNGPGVRIDGVGAANPGGIHCKDGVGTGVRCGFITDNTPPTRFISTAITGGGDSGGPAYQGTQIIGFNNSSAGLLFSFVKYSAVMNEINSPGSPFPVGKGFVVTNS